VVVAEEVVRLVVITMAVEGGAGTTKTDSASFSATGYSVIIAAGGAGGTGVIHAANGGTSTFNGLSSNGGGGAVVMLVDLMEITVHQVEALLVLTQVVQEFLEKVLQEALAASQVVLTVVEVEAVVVLLAVMAVQQLVETVEQV
jgi:hypothetical protein